MKDEITEKSSKLVKLSEKNYKLQEENIKLSKELLYLKEKIEKMNEAYYKFDITTEINHEYDYYKQNSIHLDSIGEIEVDPLNFYECSSED